MSNYERSTYFESMLPGDSIFDEPREIDADPRLVCVASVGPMTDEEVRAEMSRLMGFQLTKRQALSSPSPVTDRSIFDVLEGITNAAARIERAKVLA